MASFLLPRFSSAHTAGLAQADFDVGAGGRVDARLVFAAAEPIEAMYADPRAFFLDGVGVMADGERCNPMFAGAHAAEDSDHFEIDGAFGCAPGASRIEATLYLLSSLPRGHRIAARIAAGSATTQAVLDGEHRAIALRLGSKGPRHAVALVAVTAVFTALMLSLFAWRFAATRSRRKPSRSK